MCPWLRMVRSNVPKALGTPCSPFSKGSLPPAPFAISSFQPLILFAFGSMDALFQQELEACPFSKGGNSPISTSCYTLAAMGQLCRCLAKKKLQAMDTCRLWTHACIHVILQPKAAYFMNTYVFVEMLKQNYSRWKTHTDTHLLKTTIKRTTLQRKEHYHPPAQHIFAASEILAGFQATKAAADPLSKDRQHPFNKDSHFQSHISMLKCCHPFSKGWRLQKSEFILQNWGPSRTFRVRSEDIQSENQARISGCVDSD